MEIAQNMTANELLISGELFYDFLIRLSVNVVSTFILIRFIYYPRNSRIKYLFTFFLMGMMIFLIASILDQVSLDMGFALGLFAIFGIIRFRSPSIDLKEMTYLFLIIGISIINALVEFNIANWVGLFIANCIVVISTFIMEKYRPKNYILKRMMVISPRDFSVLNNKESLLEEVREITGIMVKKVEIEKINKVKNEVSIWIYFDENNVTYKPTEQIVQEEPESDSVWESNYSNEY